MIYNENPQKDVRGDEKDGKKARENHIYVKSSDRFITLREIVDTRCPVSFDLFCLGEFTLVNVKLQKSHYFLL